MELQKEIMFMLDNIQLLNIARVSSHMLSHMTPGHIILEEGHMLSEVDVPMQYTCRQFFIIKDLLIF